jgi:small subunit ribosomal protein S8
MSDYITDILIRIKNASARNKASISFPYSDLGMDISETLVRNGFTSGITRKGKKMKTIELALAYENNIPKVADFKRLSKQSRRVYSSFRDIKPVKNGYGKLILSTPEGVKTGEEAKKAKVGGELLFEIW